MRSLVDPDFQQRLHDNALAAIASYSLSPKVRAEFASMRIDKLRRLAGFITKVQSNHLWTAIPNTRALIKFFAIESDVFSGFHAQHQQLRHRVAVCQSDKIAAFLLFFTAFLMNGAHDKYPGLSDVFLFEKTNWQLHERLRVMSEMLPPPLPLFERASSGDSSDLCLKLNPTFSVLSFKCDPLAAIELLAQRNFSTNTVNALPPRQIACWIDDLHRQLRYMEVDSDVLALLLSIDGSLTRHNSAGPLAPEVVCDNESIRVFVDSAQKARAIIGPVSFI